MLSYRCSLNLYSTTGTSLSFAPRAMEYRPELTLWTPPTGRERKKADMERRLSESDKMTEMHDIFSQAQAQLEISDWRPPTPPGMPPALIKKVKCVYNVPTLVDEFPF